MALSSSNDANEVAPSGISLDETRRRMALDVHLAEYSGLRDLLNTHITQDRAILGIGVVMIGVLAASLGAIAAKTGDSGPNPANAIDSSQLSVVLWFVLAALPSLLSFIGIMDARTIQAGVEVNAYIVRHLGPAIERLIFDEPQKLKLEDRPLMSEHFFPRVDALHKLRRVGEVNGTRGPVRLLSGAARVALFGSPSLLALGLVAIGPYGFDLIEVSSATPVAINQTTEWLLRGLSFAGAFVFVVMMYAFVVAFRQAEEFTSWTNYPIVAESKGAQVPDDASHPTPP